MKSCINCEEDFDYSAYRNRRIFPPFIIAGFGARLYFCCKECKEEFLRKQEEKVKIEDSLDFINNLLIT